MPGPGKPAIRPERSCERQERDRLPFAAPVGCEVIGVWKETASGATDYERTQEGNGSCSGS
jgi:hypothetical protein